MNTFRSFARRSVDVAIVAAVLLWMASPPPAAAHDPGLSTGQVRLAKDRVEITLVFAVKDAAHLANVLNAVEEEPETWTPALTAAVLGRHAAGAVEADLDGETNAPVKATCAYDAAGNITVGWTLMKAPQRLLRMHSAWLAMLPLGHRQLLTVSGPDGATLGDHLLSARDDVVSWNRAAPSVQAWHPTPEYQSKPLALPADSPSLTVPRASRVCDLTR